MTAHSVAPPHLITKEKDLVDLSSFISIVLAELYDYRSSTSSLSTPTTATTSTRNLQQTPLVYALEQLRREHSRFTRSEKKEEMTTEFVVAEFGCYTGGTLGQIVEYLSTTESPNSVEEEEGEFYTMTKKIYGFDSFEGLPENWYNNRGKGWFNLDSKEISVPGAEIIKGWFEDTVPVFFRNTLSRATSVLALVHIDSDLYSSAKVVLNELGKFLRESAQFRSNELPLYLVFDELINYPEFENHEIKALYEFLLETDDFIQCELIGSDQRVKGGKPRFYRKNEPCDMRVLFQLLPRAK